MVLYLSNLEKKVQQLQKLHILTILTLVLTAGLLLEQLGHVGNSNITVLNGFFFK